MALKLLHEKKTTDSCGDYLNSLPTRNLRVTVQFLFLKKPFI